MFNDADRAYLKLRFGRIERMLRALAQQEEKQMATINDVNEAILDLGSAVDAAVQVINAATGVTPEQLDKVVADIKAQTDKLTAAVKAKVDETHAKGM